eukprot:TRINITY_DN13478_c0_g1_i1.p2 TRINITY_DN13478_c0_g1~~TRINITY_DN13478_c0_g1_i1.p2  ORF type:complete len:118 (-),score=13.01 TRINITY_DN13478_c0_g1_i1:3-356(-)
MVLQKKTKQNLLATNTCAPVYFLKNLSLWVGVGLQHKTTAPLPLPAPRTHSSQRTVINKGKFFKNVQGLEIILILAFFGRLSRPEQVYKKSQQQYFCGWGPMLPLLPWLPNAIAWYF